MSTQPENPLSTQKPAEGPRHTRAHNKTMCELSWQFTDEIATLVQKFADDPDKPLMLIFPTSQRAVEDLNEAIAALRGLGKAPAAPTPAVAPPIEASAFLLNHLEYCQELDCLDGLIGWDAATEAHLVGILDAYYAACRSKEK